MNRIKIYLDTSVLSHLDAPDVPEKMEATLKLWELLESGVYGVVLSSVVFDELTECQEPKMSYIAKRLNNIHYELIESDDAIVDLASKFIDFGILKEKSFDDCRHIAAALMSGCEVIASWNFKHIVNIKTMQGTKRIATTSGFHDIIICTPATLIDGGI